MIKALLFDLNGTVIDILTDEGNCELYRMMANLLDYYGVYLKPEAVRDFFFAHNRTQRRESSEEYPEFDVTAVFAAILDRYGSAATLAIPEEKRRWLPKFLAEAFRAGSRFKLELYSGVRQVLDDLHADYRMAAISDGQSLWALPELRRVGLGNDFEFTLVSSDFGFRKPDRRLFRVALGIRSETGSGTRGGERSVGGRGPGVGRRGVPGVGGGGLCRDRGDDGAG